MSYKTKLQTNNNNLEGNNIDLQSILNTINNLPAAGSGTEDLDAEITEQEGLIEQIEAALVGKAAGGGIEIETCTVEIIPPANKNNLRYFGISLNVLEDKKIVESYAGGIDFEQGNHIIVENVVCGSFIWFEHNMTSDYNIFIDDKEIPWYDSMINLGSIPYKNNGIVTIELQNA